MKIPESLKDFSRLIFFDTETSGLNHESCRITELSAICVESNGDIHEIDNYIILPDDIEMTEESQRVTGITREYLNEYGISEKDALDNFRKLYCGKKGRTLFAAHNAQFDMMFLLDVCKRYGIYDDFEVIDSLTVFRDRKDRGHKLSDAIRYYHLKDVKNSHCALDDCKALSAVFFEMAKQKDDLNKYVNLFGYNPNHKINGYKIEYIRYVCQEFGNYRKAGRLYEIAELEDKLSMSENPYETAVRILKTAKYELKKKSVH